MPRPYAFATPQRSELVLSVYRQAGEASAEADAAMADIAAAVRTPSRVLAVVTAGARPQGRDGVTRQLAAVQAAYESPDMAGPVERSLRELGIRDPAQVSPAAALDCAAEQLLIDAVTSPHAAYGAGLPRASELGGAGRAPEACSRPAGREPRSHASHHREQPEREAGG